MEVLASRKTGEELQRMLARLEKLETFLAAYDAWRVASDAADSLPDEAPYEEHLPLCSAEAKAEAALINLRDDLRKSIV